MNLNDNGHLAIWINVFFAVAALSVAYAVTVVTVAVRQARATHGRPRPLTRADFTRRDDAARHAA